MGNLVALEGQEQFLLVTIMVVTIGGSLTWLFGRSSYHVGASGLIMGYWGYLLVNAYHHPTLMTIALGIVCLYYFGGLLSSVIPNDAKESWEGHLFGVIAGIGTSFLYPEVAPYLGPYLEQIAPMIMPPI